MLFVIKHFTKYTLCCRTHLTTLSHLLAVGGVTGSLGLRDLPDPLAGYKGPLRGGEGKAEWKGGGKQNENVMWGKGGKRKEWGGKGGDGLSPGPLQAGRTRNLSVTSPSPILYH